MKIVRLYYKPPPEVNATPSSGRLYRRKVQGSNLISLVFCHNEEQYEIIKDASNLMPLLEGRNTGREWRCFRDNKVAWMSTSYSIANNSTNDTMEKLYDYIIANHTEAIEGYDLIFDLFRCYSSWNYGAGSYLANNIGNRVRETEDGFTTKFYEEAHPNSYYDGINVGGRIISLGLSNESHSCEDCNDYVEYGEDLQELRYVEQQDSYVCDACLEDYYVCGSCDEYIHADHSYYDEDGGNSYCENCWDNRRDDNSIHSYDYTPYLRFYDYVNGKIEKVENFRKSKVPYYGAELEVECKGNRRDRYAVSISNYGGFEEKFFYCKRDGSLSHGFEVCFMPMTFKAIKELNLEDSILKYRGRDRLQSYNTSTCGMHIHINREAFSDHHLFKFISFIHEFKSLIFLISQRKQTNELNQYAKFNNSFKDKAKKSMVDSIKSKKRFHATNHHLDSYKPQPKHSTANYGEKYVPVNLQHPDTIEVRIFKGNLMESSVRKNFEFVDSLYYFTKNNPIYRLKVKEYLDHCYREMKNYPHLNSFIEQNSAKVKEIVKFPLNTPEGLEY